MIQTALVISNSFPEAILEQLEYFPRMTRICCNAQLFEDESSRRQLADLNRYCPLVTQLLPEDALAFFEKAEDAHASNQLFKNLATLMTTAATDTNATNFCVPLRLDRIGEQDWPGTLAVLIPLFNRLLSTPMPCTFNCLVPVIMPKLYPSSNELSRAMALCKAVNEDFLLRHPLTDNHPSLKICANIYPDAEMPKGHRITSEEFCADGALMHSTEAIVFTYNPSDGETLYDDEQAQWAHKLMQADYEGIVAFNPLNPSTDSLQEILQDISDWMELYS